MEQPARDAGVIRPTGIKLPFVVTPIHRYCRFRTPTLVLSTLELVTLLNFVAPDERQRLAVGRGRARPEESDEQQRADGKRQNPLVGSKQGIGKTRSAVIVNWSRLLCLIVH